jgi:membrane-associated phospholipid phosphatase
VKFWAAWVAALVVAALVTALVLLVDTTRPEGDVLREVQAWPLPGISAARFIRSMTTTELLIVQGAVVAVALLFLRRRSDALVLAALLLVLPLAQSSLKQAIDRERPPPELVLPGVTYTSASFPSGHAMSTAVVYGWLFYLCYRQRRDRPWLVAGCVAAPAAVALVGLSTLHVGAHWPTDLPGGWSWGLALLLPFIRLADSLRPP